MNGERGCMDGTANRHRRGSDPGRPAAGGVAATAAARSRVHMVYLRG
jgi:hypothetical protein